jgi:hypothetical protein
MFGILTGAYSFNDDPECDSPNCLWASGFGLRLGSLVFANAWSAGRALEWSLAEEAAVQLLRASHLNSRLPQM